MFNIVEKHQKLVKGIMITIAATFVVWGVSGYFAMGGNDGYVAKVGSNKIYPQDLDRALDQNPQAGQDKMQLLFGLINRQLLLNAIEDNNLSVTIPQLQEAIAAIPLFSTDGKFSVAKYQDFLKQRYTTSAKFEKDVQQQLLITAMVDFYKNSYFSSVLFQNKYAALLARQRNVAQYIVDPQQFYGKINLSESDISAYYQQNLAKFTIPDQVKLQYLQLSVASVAPTIKISDADVTKYLHDHPDAANNQQIDASHILFSTTAGATAAQKAQVKARATKVLAELRANPAKFAQLAKQYSDDSSSAAKGGELGFFARGIMVKPFEAVAFKLKPGQISEVVETQYGYHIIKLNQLKVNNLATQRAGVVQQLQQQKAQLQLQVLVEQLNDLSYNKPDSLELAAQKAGVALQNSPWLSKNATASPDAQFSNPKVQQAMFSDEVLKQHHNSEVIDLGGGSYMLLRVSAYHPAQQQPLATVRPQITATLRAQLASQMASKVGAQDLALQQQDKIKLNFTAPQEVTLLGQSKDIDPQTVRQIFALPTKSFPAYTGALNASGAYVIYKINGQTTDKTLAAQNQKVIQQLAEQYSMMTLNAYIGSLRSHYKVSYKLDQIKGMDATAPLQP